MTSDASAPARSGAAAELLGVFADHARIRVVAELIDGAKSFDELRAATDMPPRELGRALSKLDAAGLLTKSGPRYVYDDETLQEVVRQEAAETDELEDVDREKAKVLRAFFKKGRLVSMPTQLSKRIVVLDHIAQSFEPGVRYAESEVNEILHAFDEDHAALRRYLVEEEYLERERGTYWRVGGSYDPA